MMSEALEDFRAEVRAWCRAHVPPGWREAQTGVSDEAFVAFQKEWFQELRQAGYAVPHWPAEWGGGLSVGEQIVLYQELAAHDAPRLVVAFVAIHHAAATLLAAGSEDAAGPPPAGHPRRGDLGPGVLRARGRLGPGQPAHHGPARGRHLRGERPEALGERRPACQWCLLLARTDPDAPKRHGISYFLMPMDLPGIEVRPIRNAVGEAHFCEIFLRDVEIEAQHLIGPENEGWRVAQATLGTERGMTMLELAERLGNAGFRWLLETCRVPGTDGDRPIDDAVVRDRLAGFETEITALRAMGRGLAERHETGAVGPADASIVKLYYSELLQRMTGFGAEVGGTPANAILRKPLSSGWESGAWVLDFIGSWEWTIPGGTSEIQRTIIAERGLSMPRAAP